MKKLTLYITSFVICLTANGQQINQPTNLYRGGDILEKKQVIVKGFSLKGMSRDCPLTSPGLSPDIP